MRAARRFLVHGRVQGVGYRYCALDAARRETVTGGLRNLDDGVVEAFVEGEADAVERVERVLRRGPTGAYVASVHVEIKAPTGAWHDFLIT